MSPYRTAPPADRPKLVFGDDRKRVRNAILGLLLIALTIAGVVAWFVWGGRVNGSIVLPAIFGLALLGRASAGSIELHEREVEIVLRRFIGNRKHRFAKDEITGLTIMPRNFTEEKPDYELRLLLTSDRSVCLLRAKNEAELEPSRAAVGAFLLDNGLLQPPPAHVRVAAPAPVEARLLDGSDGDGAASEDARAGRREGRR